MFQSHYCLRAGTVSLERLCIVPYCRYKIALSGQSTEKTAGDLDKLYALTSNPISMFSVFIIKNAFLAALMGTIPYFAPAATLSVIPVNIIIPVPNPVLNETKFLLDAQTIGASLVFSIS
ncbi:hypothetical protein BPAE_0189g00180 [Botrytis paeoniae]|uniref:Uncharacterized protein n=1 Tax=Botrytis paeoniae TaxID=278948 RepID=A0A4Z1FC22_9HELO|nr:hypothetical protein BPAE_0189g00180 [Botrytis paeoniae]